MVLGTRSAVLQRRLEIADRIRRHGAMRVEALAATLGVSVVTIRADLTYLEEQGLVVRSSGKARPAPLGDENTASVAGVRRGTFLPMLRAAATLIGHDRTLLLGSGPLPVQLLPELSERTGLVLLLTALDAVAMARHCLDARLHVLGGELGADGNTLGGPQSVHGLAAHRVDVFVMQASMVAAGHLVLPPGASEPLARAGCRHAADSIVLVSDDAAQLGHGDSARIPLADIGHLALARAPGQALRTMLAEAGFAAHAMRPGDSLLFSNPGRAELRRSA